MNNKKNKINYSSAISAAIVAIIIFCVIAVVFNVMPVDALPVNFIGATLGALIGALITLILLRGQTAIEEEKEKNIRILEKKTAVFQDFIDAVWEVWKDQVITIEEFQTLTSKYYQKLMIYLKEEKSKTIGDALSVIGSKIGKNSFKDTNELRAKIVTIIDKLSEDINLGGKIDTEIMDEHDKILFPLLFREKLLDAINKQLPTGDNGILKEGKYEDFKEGRYSLKCLVFYFKKYSGCKMILGPFNKGSIMKFALVIDSKYHQVDSFRAKNPYNQRIEMGDIIIGDPVFNPVKDIEFQETDNEKGNREIDFSDVENMEKYRVNKRDFADTLANRAAYYFEAMKCNNLSIPDFLEKYIKE